MSTKIKNLPCYLCGSSQSFPRKGQVRDNSDLAILQCKQCGLVFLDSRDHINEAFYEKSSMHGDDPVSIDDWLKSCAVDDSRRFEMLWASLVNKHVLDFGCGAGGFLKLAKGSARKAIGLELDPMAKNHWKDELTIVSDMSDAGSNFDIITSFHVFEHLSDPRETLRELSRLLAPDGKIVIEVPNSEDALLTLYGCDGFQKFTYWSQHLFLFNASTLENLARQAGLRVTAIKHLQRYPLSNHLYWLSKQKPGGHQHWSFFDSIQLSQAYADTLASVGKTDTLIAYLELFD